MPKDWLRYQNQRATRNRPLSPELAEALSFLPEIGVGVEVFSGGQSSTAEGGPRTGSTRHDHGHAADVFFTRDGRRLDWSNPDDLPLFTEIVQRGKAAGLTGFGAGDGYMQPGSMHVGFGSPGVWGAGGRGANAPDWLRAAYGEAPTGSAGETQMAGRGRGDAMLYGGAGGDTLGMAPTGGLGGLGGTAEPPVGGFRGFIGSPEFGDMLQAFGASLMSSPSNAPLAGFGDAYEGIQDRRMRQAYYDDQRASRQEARDEKRASQDATVNLLMSRGLSADQARALAANPSAATAALQYRDQDALQARGNMTADRLEAKHPDIAAAIRDQSISGEEGWKLAYQRDREGVKAPNLETIYTEEGREQKGYFNRDGVWTDVGSAKAASGGGNGVTISPDGTIQVGGAAPGGGAPGTPTNIPSGFMVDPNDPRRLTPIPGGPGEQIGGENAGRIGIAKSFLDDLPGIRDQVQAGGATGIVDALAGRAGFGQAGQLYARIESGADALQRMLSGAGMPESEAAAYARRYMPSVKDTPDIVMQKLSRMESELSNQMAIVTRGRGNIMAPGTAGATSGSPGLVPGSDAGGGMTAPAPVRRARNPQTGETVEFRNGQWVPVR